jgi:hypothetical protein
MLPGPRNAVTTAKSVWSGGELRRGTAAARERSLRRLRSAITAMASPTATKPRFENVFEGCATSPGCGPSQKQFGRIDSKQPLAAPGQPARPSARSTASVASVVAAVRASAR